MNENRQLLLHICCAPCGSGCVTHPYLAERKYKLFYSNSNLNSFEEYEKRLFYVKKLAEIYSLELLADPYDHNAWLNSVRGFENAPERGERCRLCFNFALSRTAEYAAKLNCSFATTLTVSPHKSSRLIFETGSQWAHFEPLDFKKKDGYLTGNRLSREYGFYRQNYCGCEFSLTASEN